MVRTFIVGDVHGHYEKLITLLQYKGLIDDHRVWSGGNATLAFVGDLVDRGPDGIGVIEFVMRLQDEAQRRGGRVMVTMGNHDFMILAAYRFANTLSMGAGGSFIEDWKVNGGNSDDLKRLTKRHAQWLLSLPAMVALGDTLLVHADAAFYMNYGLSIEEVNASFKRILKEGDAGVWDKLLGAFAEHKAFYNMDMEHVRQYLRLYGVKRLVHGHTPIYSITGTKPHNVITPLIYAEGLCVNVDGCFYAGGNGFVYELS
jgi:hypothetical protein